MNPDDNDSDRDNGDTRMGLAPVFAAALAAACCLALAALVALFAGGTGAAILNGGSGLLSLFIIGFALGGVLVVVLAYLRSSRRRGDESSHGETRQSRHSQSTR